MMKWNNGDTRTIKTGQHTCTKCCDWEMEGSSKPFQGHFPNGFRYPKSVAPNSPPLPIGHVAGMKCLLPFR